MDDGRFFVPQMSPSPGLNSVIQITSSGLVTGIATTTTTTTMVIIRTISVYTHVVQQKDELGQDMLLLGPPGFYRRHLVFKYCQIMNREYEFISINRDTSESDLKQVTHIFLDAVQFP